MGTVPNYSLSGIFKELYAEDFKALFEFPEKKARKFYNIHLKAKYGFKQRPPFPVFYTRVKEIHGSIFGKSTFKTTLNQAKDELLFDYQMKDILS